MNQSKDYIDKIKEKYGIKTQKKTKFITIDEYDMNLQNIKLEIEKLFREAIPNEKNNETYIKACDTFACEVTDYRIVELFEDLEPDTYVRALWNDSNIIKTIQGFVHSSSPEEILIKTTLDSQKTRKIKRDCLILTKYSDSQMTALKLNRLAVKYN